MIRDLPTLREIRERHAHSQESLALLAQISRRTVSGIELGRHIPKPVTRRKIAQALNLKPWQLRWPDRAA